MPTNTRKKPYPELKKERMYAKIDSRQGTLAGILLVLVLCFQPLYVNFRDGYRSLTWHKFLFFAVYMACILAASAAIWIYRMSVKPRLLPRGKPGFIDCAVMGYAAVTVLSAIFSPYRENVNVWVGIQEPGGRYDGAITQLLYVSLYFIISRWYVRKNRHMAMFGIAAIIIALIGILQFYGFDFLRLWPNDDPSYRVQNFYYIYFRSTLGNVNIVSTFVCVAILLCGFLFVRCEPSEKGSGRLGGGHVRWLWLAASALCYWLMELAGSDSGFVGVVAATFLAIPFIVETRRTLGRFFILASSWVAAFTMQKLFFEVVALGSAPASGLLVNVGVFAVLLGAGLLLTLLKKTHEAPSAQPAGKSGSSEVGARESSPIGEGGGSEVGTRESSPIGESGGSEVGARNAPSAQPVKWKLGVILMAAVLAAGLAAVELLGRRDMGSGFAGRILSEAREVLHGNIRDEFGTYRIYIWRNALSALPKNPVIGSGPDTFYFAFPAEAHGVYGEPYDKAHNEYIQILICQGVLGLACYLAYLAGVFMKSVRAAFRDPFIMAVLAAFAGYCAQAFFNISVPIASQFLWVLAGLLSNKKLRSCVC